MNQTNTKAQVPSFIQFRSQVQVTLTPTTMSQSYEQSFDFKIKQS